MLVGPKIACTPMPVGVRDVLEDWGAMEDMEEIRHSDAGRRDSSFRGSARSGARDRAHVWNRKGAVQCRALTTGTSLERIADESLTRMGCSFVPHKMWCVNRRQTPLLARCQTVFRGLALAC